MPDWVRIADLPGPDEGSGTKLIVDDVEVGLFRIDGELRAISDRCPHQGASLVEGTVQRNCVVCPWHSWKFDLTTGELDGRANGRGVGTFGVRADEDGIWLDRETLPKADESSGNAPIDDDVRRYLIRYGSLGWIGLFGTVDEVECEHRDRVVVQTHRGLELGEVLSDPATQPIATGDAKPAGEILRVAASPEVAAHSARVARSLNRLIDDSQKSLDAASLPVSIMDGELLFDAESAVLYFVGESHPDAGPLVTAVARQHGLQRIELESFLDAPPESGGCGKPGCGGGGGGCHS